MKEILKTLSTVTGYYEGEGINHEVQSFIGRLALQPILDGRSFTIKFSVTGKDGTVYHQEESTIAPRSMKNMAMPSFIMDVNSANNICYAIGD